MSGGASEEVGIDCLARQARPFRMVDESRVFSALLVACGEHLAWQAAVALLDAGISDKIMPRMNMP